MKKIIRFFLICITCSFSLCIFSHKAHAAMVKPKLTKKLTGLNAVVVQTAATVGKHKYVLQRLHNNSVIYRSVKNRKHKTTFSYKSQLYLNNFGHTQTLIHLNSRNWLVGCHPRQAGNYNWSTELAVVPYPKHKDRVINSYHCLAHLTNLKSATDLSEAKRRPIIRSEAAISPNHKLLLIATIDTKNTGNFAVYHFSTIKHRLNKAKRSSHKSVNLANTQPISAFHIKHFYGDRVNSVQGYALDNEKNIYISEELNSNNKTSHNIIKFAWDDTNPDQFKRYHLINSHWKPYRIELEGIELKNNTLYVSTAFHTHKQANLENKIYRIKNILN